MIFIKDKEMELNYMNKFKLVTTEKFGELDCNFYRNMNNDILLTRYQIGTALEYVNPDDSLSKIHKRHKDRLDKFSVVATLSSTDNKKYNTLMYTIKGVMEICRWSRQPKADKFIDFTWDVMSRLLFSDGDNNDNSSILLEINKLKDELHSIKYLITPQSVINKYSKWRGKTNNKINLLMDYLNKSYKEILSNLYIVLEDTYDLDLNECRSEYCFQTGITNCYPLDVIENNKELRNMFDFTIDYILERYNLIDEVKSINKRETIFI